MRLLSVLFAVLFLTIASCTGPADQKNNQNDKMEWWRNARFGMFIHWGLYAVPAGEWEGSTNHAEWIRTTAQIPLETYNKFVEEFNPVDFNAMDWVKMAKEAGMKYIVITSKHHDGFCLFDSEYTDYDIMSTPFKRDIMKELSDACEKEGIEMCWYHSIMDWHHPDYLPRRSWETERSVEGADYSRYISYMKNQLKELTSGYGDIGVIWFDGEWESSWTHEMGIDLYDYVNGLQDNIIVNNRVDKGRQGMMGMTKEGEYRGDFGTPEQEIPETGLKGIDWETCMTMNNHWGYNSYDNNWKSEKDLIRKLVDIASKGGNFLLNVGPKADGTFPKESIERLKAIGEWMDKYSESIYETSASPFKGLEWGRCTSKKIGNKTRLYLHLFDIPEDNKIVLPGIQNKILSAYMLDSGKNLEYVRNGSDLHIEAPEILSDPNSTVLVVDVKGDPKVYDYPLIVPIMGKFVDSGRFGFDNIPDGLDVRFTADGSDPSLASEIYTGDVSIAKETIVKAAYYVKNKRVSGIVSKKYSDIELKPSLDIEVEGPGLKASLYEGSWDEMPDFASIKTAKLYLAPKAEIAKEEGLENYAIIFDGYILIPQDGLFDFVLASDDGSILILDEEEIINNDGIHGALELNQHIALAMGYHKIRIEYFQKGGGSSFSLKLSGPGIEKDDELVNLFFH